MKLITQTTDVAWAVTKRADEDFDANIWVLDELVYQIAHCSSASEAREFVLAFLKKLVFDL